MGLLTELERRQRLENPATPISSAAVMEALGFGESTPAGVTINSTKALGLSAFWAGVRMISQTIAGLPLGVYEHTDKGRRLAAEHPVHRLLSVSPNSYMNAFQMKELQMVHLLMKGNSYNEIEWSHASKPVGLWPLSPDGTTPYLRSGQKFYDTMVGDEERPGSLVRLGNERVLHIAGMGWDGIQGYNVVHVHRDTLGLTHAANEYGARFFGNSGRPSGYLSHPGKPGIDERVQFRDEWNNVHGGLSNAQRTAVLWGGMKFEKVSLDPEDAQFLQTRAMQIEEVARILNINPILLQHHEKATTWGSGVAQFLIAFAKFTIIPWMEREEAALNKALFTPEEQGRFYVKYNANALLRGDLEMQAKILEIKRRNGVINADEWRALDDENPLPDGLGEHYMMPLNMKALSEMVPSEGDDVADGQDVQATALNGAQIASLLSILEQVTQKQLSPDAAKAAISASFPSLDDAEINAMVDSSTSFEPASDDGVKSPPADAGTRMMEPRSAATTHRQRDAHRSLFEDGARRFIRRDVQNLTKAIERAFATGDPVAVMNRWIDEFYPGQHRVIAQTMEPIVAALAEIVAADATDGLSQTIEAEDIQAFAREYTDTLAQREVGSSIGQLRAIMAEAATEDLHDSLMTRASEWNETRPVKVAMREVVAVASGAVRKAAQVTNTKLKWRANPGACPLCQEMDGRTISATGYFLSPGESISADGSDPLRSEVYMGGPPLHKGCTCDTVLV